MTEKDWETMSRGRLEKLVADTVERIRQKADQIEAEAGRHMASAAKDDRFVEFETYPRVAIQMINALQSMLFNLNLGGLIDAAADAEAARTERKREQA